MRQSKCVLILSISKCYSIIVKIVLQEKTYVFFKAYFQWCAAPYRGGWKRCIASGRLKLQIIQFYFLWSTSETLELKFLLPLMVDPAQWLLYTERCPVTILISNLWPSLLIPNKLFLVALHLSLHQSLFLMFLVWSHTFIPVS